MIPVGLKTKLTSNYAQRSANNYFGFYFSAIGRSVRVAAAVQQPANSSGLAGPTVHNIDIKYIEIDGLSDILYIQ